MSDGDSKKILLPQTPQDFPDPDEVDSKESRLNRMAMVAGLCGILIATTVFLGIFYLCIHLAH